MPVQKNAAKNYGWDEEVWNLTGNYPEFQPYNPVSYLRESSSKTGTINVMHKGTSNTITVTSSDTIATLNSKLSPYNMKASITNGIVTIENSNTDKDIYIKTMSDDLASTLKIGVGNDKSYHVDTLNTATNGESQEYNFVDTITADASKTLQDLGINNSQTISIVKDGNKTTLTINNTSTCADIAQLLTENGIESEFSNGKLYISGDENYVTEMSADLKNLLNIVTGKGHTYTVERFSTGGGGGTSTTITTTYTNTTSAQNVVNKTNAKISLDTTLESINGYSGGSGKIVIHKDDGTFSTIVINSTKTLGDLFDKLESYGFVCSVGTDGKVEIQGVGNTYLQSVSGGSNLLTALKLSNVETVNKTIRQNSTSNSLKYTATVTATGVSQLQNIAKLNGDTISFGSDGKATITIATTKGSTKNNKTLTFTKDQTIFDVINELRSYGLNATLDSQGQFSITSSTLDDFTISGGLGTFLMGSYSKEYDIDSVNNVSAKLVDKFTNGISDSTSLSSLGITNGNLDIVQNGVHYTVQINTTNLPTIGDFRSLLSMYGFNSELDSSGRLTLSADGDSYIASVSGGSNIADKLGLTDWKMVNLEQSSDVITNANTSKGTATLSTKLADLVGADNNNLGITNGKINVYHDGTKFEFAINTNDTLEDLKNQLSSYGITLTLMSDGKVRLTGDGNSYLSTDGISSGASNILIKLGITNWTAVKNSESEKLDYNKTVTVAANGSTLLKDLKDSNGNSLGITKGQFYVYKNDAAKVATITDDMTVDDFASLMRTYGFDVNISSSGSIELSSDTNMYLKTSALSGENSNIVSKLFSSWNIDKTLTSDTLQTSKTTIENVELDTKFKDLYGKTYQSGLITVVKDGVKTNISLGAEESFTTFIAKLKDYGIDASLDNDGKLSIKTTGNSSVEKYSGSGASNILDILNVSNQNNWNKTNSYEGSVSITNTSQQDVKMDKDTKLEDLGITTGEYYIYKNGVKITALIGEDETVGSFIDTLKTFGLNAAIIEDASGKKLYVNGSGDSYVAQSNSVTNASNIVSKLFNNNKTQSFEYSGLQQTSSILTTKTAATEETLVSAFDKSGKPSAGNLSVCIDGKNSNISISTTETFATLIDKFKSLGIDAHISDTGVLTLESGFKTFSINTAGTSSNLVSNLSLQYKNNLGGYSQSYEEVMSTVEETRSLSAAKYADLNTKLNSLNISEGTLSVYKDGAKALIQIDKNDTFDSLRAKIAAKFSDVDITFENGYLKIYSKTQGVKVSVGATTDSSNFSAITGISSKDSDAAMSARELYCVNGDSLVTASNIFRKGKVTEGNFIVGTETINITATTTISDVISQINNSEKTNATAYWNSIEGKLEIKSNSTGAALINIEKGTSNFTDILGFTISNNGVSGINLDAQELGENARFSINGTYFTSASNKVTSDVSRIKGLTIDLKGVTEGTPVTLSVERDKETLANAISDVVDAYNELIENVDKAIASDGALKKESTLKLMRNQLHSLMTSSELTGTTFKNLFSIGISVESAKANNISTKGLSIMQFDKEKFFEAFQADQSAVKTLLVGNGKDTGIFTKIENLLENSLKAVSGYFDSANNSFNKKIKSFDNKIDKAENALNRYKAQLEKKFNSMDRLIANVQQQYSSFLAS